MWVPTHRHLGSLGVPDSIELSLEVEQVSCNATARLPAQHGGLWYFKISEVL